MNITVNQNLHEVTKEDDEKSIEVLTDWSMKDFEDSGEEECTSFMVPPIPLPESLVDPCNDMPNNSSVISGVLPVPMEAFLWTKTSVTTVRIITPVGSVDQTEFLVERRCLSVLALLSGCVRSKRSQSAIFSQQPTSNLTSLKSCNINVENQPMPNSYITSESEYFAESHPPYTPNVDGKVQKKMNRKQKCSHCETTKTSLWRECPMGRGTLCNACGVRYRTGKLFPEYRPKASPTFVASIHSSSHKKVLEMRVKGTPAI